MCLKGSIRLAYHTHLALTTQANLVSFSLAVMILVKITQSAVDESGNSLINEETVAFGYDNATAGVDGSVIFQTSTSTDPAYELSNRFSNIFA